MITALTHITLLVNDQQKALDFYTKVLGFEIHTDAMFGQERWLTICPPTQPNLEIAIMKASEIEAPLIGHQAGGKPFLTFATSNCALLYEQLEKKGVSVLSKPKQEPWGMSMAIQDPDGTVLYINEPMQ